VAIGDIAVGGDDRLAERGAQSLFGQAAVVLVSGIALPAALHLIGITTTKTLEQRCRSCPRRGHERLLVNVPALTKTLPSRMSCATPATVRRYEKQKPSPAVKVIALK
jgi:hypothetical protein